VVTQDTAARVLPVIVGIVVVVRVVTQDIVVPGLLDTVVTLAQGHRVTVVSVESMVVLVGQEILVMMELLDTQDILAQAHRVTQDILAQVHQVIRVTVV